MTGAKTTGAREGTLKPYDLATGGADYPPWTEPLPARTFLLCSTPRCGSTLLGEALYAAGGMGCPLEYFHRGFRPAFACRWGAPDDASYRRAVYRYRTDPTGSLGVKLFWDDLLTLCAATYPEVAALVEVDSESDARAAARLFQGARETAADLFPEPSWIFLARRDRLRQAVSAHIAKQTQLFRWYPGGEGAPLREARYDYDAIARAYAYAIRSGAAWERFFAAAGIVPHRLLYEELADDYAGSIRALMRALGRQGAPIPPPRLRRQSSALSEQFLIRFLREQARRAAHDATDALPPSIPTGMPVGKRR